MIRRFRALKGDDYDRQWRELEDFVRYHPGARHRRRLALKAISSVSYADYLDVGCGPGDFLQLILRNGTPAKQIWGADLSTEVIEKNRKRFSGVTFEQLDIEREHLNRQFDLISCLEVIEHLDDRDQAMTHLRAMLSPGGHLLITCPTGKVFETERHFGHVSHPDAREIRGLAQRHQLDLIQITNWGFPTYRLLKTITNINPDWAIKNFGADYGWKEKGISKLLYWMNYLNLNSPLGCQLIILLRAKT